MDVRWGFPLKPGKCFVCGTAQQDQWVVDLSKEDPNVVQHSRVYLCSTCTIAAAKQLGVQAGWVVLTDDEYAALRAETGDDALKEKMARYRDVVDDVRSTLTKAADL